MELSTSRLNTGSRIYFFDVKRGPSGAKRLEIKESRRKGEGFDRQIVTVFEEDVAMFVSELLKAVSAMGEAHGAQPVRQKAPAFAAIREKYPNAYKPWTPDEDSTLREELGAQMPVNEIAIIHLRKPSAIRSRITKLDGTG